MLKSKLVKSEMAFYSNLYNQTLITFTQGCVKVVWFEFQMFLKSGEQIFSSKNKSCEHFSFFFTNYAHFFKEITTLH